MPESRTEYRLLAFGESLAEAGWLVALATVPLVADLFSDGAFEPPKVRLLQSIAWLLAAALAIRFGLQGRSVLRAARRNPIIVAALGVGLSAAVSTVLSIAPRVSLWGDFGRAQGLATALCYLLVFLAVSFGVRRTAQARALILSVVVAGSLVAIVALAQHSGIDPLLVVGDTTRRATSTLGNPIFMAAYLGIGTLLATAVAVACTGVRRFTWGAAALLQATAFLAGGSRGPTIGLLAGFGLLCWLLRPPRRRFGAADLDGRRNSPGGWWRAGAAVSGVLVVLALMTSIGPLRASLESLGLSRMGTIRVRLDAWEAVSRTMLAPRATAAALRTGMPNLRMPFGYGPETASFPLGLHIADDLPTLTQAESRLDRAHNVVLQQLAERGSVGVAALLALWFLLLRSAIGAARSPTDAMPRSTAPTATTAMLAVAGGLLVPWLVAGSIAWSGLGAAVALTAVVLWPALTAGRRPQERTDPRQAPGNRQREILMAGVGTALLAHFVELQSGIAVTPTSLAFWALAGLLASPWGRGESEPEAPRQQLDRIPWIVGVATGTLLVSISQPPDAISGPLAAVKKLIGAAATPSATTGLVVLCLAAAALLAAAEGRGWRQRSAGAAIALGTACAVTLLAAFPLYLAPAFRGVDPGRYAAALAAASLARTAFAVLVVLSLAKVRPWQVAWRAVDRHARVTRSLLVVAIFAALIGPQAWAAVAATFGGIAGGDASASRTTAAVALYRRALDLQPGAATRWRGLARVHRAAAEQEPATAADHLVEARAALERAVELTPMEFEVHGELGTTLMRQALSSPAAPAPLIALAIAHLERALELRPTSRRALAALRSARTLQTAIGN